MESLDRLDPAARKALEAHVARLRHDLGKYVAFQVRAVDATAPLSERRDALAADLLETRRGPGGTVDAWTIWSDARTALVGPLAEEPPFVALDQAMGRVREAIAALRGGRAGEDDVRRGTEAALAVADACRALLSRVRGS